MTKTTPMELATSTELRDCARQLGLSGLTVDALRFNGVYRVEQLIALTPSQLKAMPRIGHGARLEQIEAAARRAADALPTPPPPVPKSKFAWLKFWRS